LNGLFTEDDRSKFTKYVAYLFSETRFAEIDGFTLKEGETLDTLRETFAETCKDTAERNVYGSKTQAPGLGASMIEALAKKVAATRNAHITTIEVETRSQSFEQFEERYTTPRQREYIQIKESIGDVRDNIKENLRHINDTLDIEGNTSGITPEARAERMVINMQNIRARLEIFKRYAGEDIPEMLEDIEKFGLTEIDKVLTLLQDPQTTLELFETLLKFNLILESAENNFNAELCEYDYLTGLKNKDEFEKRLDSLHEAICRKEAAEPINLISIDLGYLKYFNKKGNRDIGNLAIRAAGYVLAHCETRFPGIEVYRTGGDEFSIIVRGDNKETIKEILEFIHRTTAEMGEIPGDGKELGQYIPQQLQFNTGYALEEDAYSGLDLLTRPDYDIFSPMDIEKLSSDTPNYDPSFRAMHLSKLQKMISGMVLEEEKLVSRIEYLRGMVLQGDLDRFRNLYSFSGKALKGIDPEAFITIAKEQPNLPVKDLMITLMEMQGTTPPLSDTKINKLAELLISSARKKVTPPRP